VLEAESGYQLATRQATDLESAVLGGRWSEAFSLFGVLGVLDLSSSSSAASGMLKAIDVTTAASQIKFLITQQKYLELLETGQQKKALAVLRTELRPVVRDSDVLHTLSG
jgi:hypothetical protein